nr:hypothetical protein [Tanacetum cinerariifolium]
MEFLLKSKEKIEEEEHRAIKSINETQAQKAAKRKKLNEEAKDDEDLKQHLEIVPDEDDDVYTEATPLARKVSVVDYQSIAKRVRRIWLLVFQIATVCDCRFFISSPDVTAGSGQSYWWRVKRTCVE